MLDDLRRSRILVTGGLGFIGSHLVRRLVADGHAVTVIDDESTGKRQNIADLVGVDVQIDTVLDRDAVARAARGCAWVVHLASVVGMQLAMRTRESTYRVAVDGTRHVLEESGDVPILLMSSSCVYGHEAAPCSETNTITRDTALAFDGGTPGYATGKWELERMGRAASDAGRRVLIVRPFNVVGERQVSDYGMVLPRFIESATRGGPLVLYGDGHQERSFSDVDTFIDCLMDLMQCQRAWEPGQNIVNLGAPHSTSVRELAECVRTELQVDVPVKFVPFADVFPGIIDVRRRVPDVDRLEGYVGRRAWPHVRTIVRRMAGVDRNE